MLSLLQLQIVRNAACPRIDHEVYGVIGEIPDMGELKSIPPP